MTYGQFTYWFYWIPCFVTAFSLVILYIDGRKDGATHKELFAEVSPRTTELGLWAMLFLFTFCPIINIVGAWFALGQIWDLVLEISRFFKNDNTGKEPK